MLLIISLIFCTRDIFFSFIYFFVNIVYYVVHIVCEVDVIANSLVLYLPFCSTLNKNFFFFFFHEQLVDRIRDAPCYSLSFGECMNKISQNEPMDFIVRY